jgi:DNA polymerase III delta prime subunit
VSSNLPWPETVLEPAAWEGVRGLLRRCIALREAAALPGSLLLVGEPGLGREALAIELAAALVCRRGGDAGCGCHACQRVRRGVHPDVAILAVEPQKTLISLEQVHEVVAALPQHPFEGERRVILVSSAHTPPLGAEAASALLKSVEEPPPHVTFLLLAANPARVLPTIVSRTVEVRVPPPHDAEAAVYLQHAFGLPPETAESLLDGAGSAAAAINAARSGGGADTAELEDLLRRCLKSDVLALSAVAQRVRAQDGVAAAVDALLRQAEGGVEDAERALQAAAALLVAARRADVLHLDLEAVVTGGLASLVAEPPPD